MGTSLLPAQDLVTRAAAWYLRDFPILRGKGVANRLLGRFLRVRIPGGSTLRLINPLEYHQKTLLFRREPYEVEETRLLMEVLRPGMVVLDVGANMGYYALIASEKVGPSGAVHAFEPAPEQFEHLSLNVRINGRENVFLNNCAVAEASGTRQLFLADGWNQGTHSLGPRASSTRVQSVPCVTIDEYVRQKGVERVDVVKVDVEGAELFVFLGARETIATMRPPLIVFEACEEHTRALDTTTREVKQLLSDLGYTLYRLEPSGTPAEISISSEEPFVNIAALHESAEPRYLEALRTACARA